MVCYNDMLFTHNDAGGGGSKSYLVRPGWDHNIYSYHKPEQGKCSKSSPAYIPLVILLG